MSPSPKSLTQVPAVRPRPPRVTHRWSFREREGLLARFRRSGLSQKRFCQENDLPLSTLQYWLSQERLQSPPLEASFVQLPAPVATACLPGAHELPMGAVQIRLPSQIELQVAAGADPVWVGALLRGVLAC
jgi:transposase-like protein